MDEAPQTHYAQTPDGIHVAYQVLGARGIDLVIPSTFLNSIADLGESMDAHAYRPYRRMASFGRVIRYDRRGIGLSDPLASAEPPSLEQWMQDGLAVMDTVGCDRAAILGVEQVSGLVAALLAATHPERVTALVLMNSSARLAWASDYPWGLPPEAQQRLEERIERNWPDALPIQVIAPSAVGDEHFQRWWRQSLLMGARPATAAALTRIIFQSDVRHVLPTIRVPTLVLHLSHNRLVPVEHGRYLAEHIPGSRYVELAGQDHLLYEPADVDTAFGEIQEFLTGVRHTTWEDRVLVTLLFTDIVASTERASRLGDRDWGELLDSHYAVVRQQLDRFRGREVKTTGDGVLATFDGPARAILCARSIVDGARHLGVELRAGLHTGEVELRGGEVGGLAVHIAARVSALANASEVLVSRTVKDLVAGSGIGFTDRGVHALKGVPDEWQLFAVQGEAF